MYLGAMGPKERFLKRERLSKKGFQGTFERTDRCSVTVRNREMIPGS